MNNAKPHVMFFIGSMGGGGAERQTIEILKKLDRNEFSPFLYLQHRSGPLLSEVPDDVPIISFWDQFAKTFRAKWHHLLGTTERARWGHLRKTLRDLQIDLLYNRTHLATLDAAKACRQTSVRRISACDCDPIEELKKFGGNEFEKAKRVAKSAYETADRVIAISEGIRTRLVRDIGVSESNCVLHYNCIDLQNTAQLAISDRISLPPDRLNLLTVARLGPEKGHSLFLEALSTLVHQHGRTNLLWHVVGTGVLETELRRQVAAFGLESYVSFAGFQANPFPWYQAADLFCLPSLHEAFGCVLIEALACGLPVLATDCPGGPSEVLGHGEFGLVVPANNPDALVNGVLQFIKQQEQWQERTTAAYGAVEERFSTDHLIPKLQSFFWEVLNKK